MKTGIIIPTYNEKASIGGIISALKNLGISEILVVDDGSEDNTSEIACSKGAIVIENGKNLGKGECIKQGIKYFISRKIDGVIFMDGDGQHNPNEITHFLNKSKDENVDIIIGNRMNNTKTMPLIRLIANKVMSFIIFMLCGQYVPDSQCGYRYVSKKLLNMFSLSSSNYEIESEMILETAKKRIKIYSVPITTIYKEEISKINPVKDTYKFVKLVLKYIFKKL